MKVYLLPLENRQSFFYFEDDADLDPEAPGQPGLRGWVDRTAHRVRTSLRNPKGRLAQKLRQAWDALQRRIHPDEPLLAALRRARTIDVYHGLSVPAAEARALWFAYLRRRNRRHLPWLFFDAVLALVTVVLALLPGPNVIGYWFAYRAVRHVLIVLGIRRALSGRVETTFQSAEGLDPGGDPADGAWRARTVQRYALYGLHDFVARIAPEPAPVASGDEKSTSGGA